MLFLDFFRNASARAGRLPRILGPGTVAVWFSVLVASGCANSADSSPEAAGDGDASGDGDSPGDPTSDETMRFEPSGTLMLAPSEAARLEVVVSPARRQTVTFELLTESVEFDGFLLENSARVDENGIATVELKAPTHPSIFTARASLGEGLQVTRAISVSDQGYGTVKVVPSYSGLRSVNQWTASARAGTTCEALGSLWNDGPLVSTGGTQATIEGVPAGPSIAVAVRGGQLVSGCTTVTGLADGDTKVIDVLVVDRPLDVQNGRLNVTLGVESMTTAFASHLEAAVAEGLAAFRAEDDTDANAFLTKMGAELEGAEATDFSESIATHSLVAEAEQVWSAPSPISERIEQLLLDAANSIPGEAVFVGELELEGASSPFTLSEAGGVPAAVSGFFQSSVWSAMGEAGDTLVIGGTLSYEPLRWLAGIADTGFVGGGSQALVDEATCIQLADALISAAGGSTHGTCDNECLQGLCEQAARSIWLDVSTAGTGLSSLQVGMSGEVVLTGPAHIKSMLGQWVGRRGDEDTSLKGSATLTRMPEE